MIKQNIKKKIKKKKKVLKNRMILVLNTIRWFLNLNTYKDPNIWVFGAIRGRAYLDNAKYLFEYINENTSIDAVWITKKLKVVEEIRAKGYKAFLENSDEAKYYASRAKVAIVTHRGNKNKSDLPFCYFNEKTKIIQLWHGIPLKKIAYDDKVFSFKHNEYSVKYKLKMKIMEKFFPFVNYVHKPSMILALGEETQNIFSKAFRTPKEKVKITGYPRYDVLIANKNRIDNNKRVIYMPTFRGSVNSKFDLFLQYGFDVEKIDFFLQERDIFLDIKLHPFNRPSKKLREQIEKSKYIFLLEDIQIYEEIHKYSILITDYSSIFFDYLLLDRPIIFAPFDKEQYVKKDREFYFNYEEVTPGPKAYSWNDVLEYIDIFNKNPLKYKNERQIIKNRFHKYEDTKNCKRVYREIKKII
jgi:CDP-glycerol glycerophosphotransferase